MQGKTLTIDQMLSELEQQKDSIERAISALREVTGTGMQVAPSATATAGLATSAERRGRPPKDQRAMEASSIGAERDDRHSTKKRQSKARRKRPTYTDDFKSRVVAAVRNGLSFGEASKKFNTTWFSVREWANSGRFEPMASETALRRR